MPAVPDGELAAQLRAKRARNPLKSAHPDGENRQGSCDQAATAHESLSILKIFTTISSGKSVKMSIFHIFVVLFQKAQVPQLHKKA